MPQIQAGANPTPPSSPKSPASSVSAPLGERDPNKPAKTAQANGRKRKSNGAEPKTERPNKATKRDAGKDKDALLDTGDVELPGEHTGSVSVYDTCGEVRRKMRALIGKGVSQAALARTLSKMLPEDGGKVSPRVLTTFLNQKHLMDGNTSPAFYAGYVFFEKQRVKNQKSKTKTRMEMEEAHGKGGVKRNWSFKDGFLTLHKSERAHVDKYGRMQITKR